MRATWVSYHASTGELRTVPSELRRLGLSVNLISFGDAIDVGVRLKGDMVVADAQFNPFVPGAVPPDDHEIMCPPGCDGVIAWINGHIVYSQLQRRSTVLLRLQV